MAKIVLVNPSEQGILENAGDRMPLGLLSVATNMVELGNTVDVFDLNHTPEADLYDHIKRDKPDAVGISVYTSPIANRAIEIANKISSNSLRKIAGGYHATAMPHTLEPYFDSIVVGEGENGMQDALSLDGIVTGTTPDLNRMSSPIFNFLDVNNYNLQQSNKRTATLITSRGCPNACAFCGKMDRNVRYEPVRKVRSQMEELKDLGFEAFYFVDDVFTKDIGRVEQILKGNTTPFRATTRADMTSDKAYQVLARGGCDWLSFGIESGDDSILRRSRKGMTTKDNLNAIRSAHDAGINTKGFFILGLPGETKETARKTIDFSHKLRDNGLTSADFYFLTPFPGTPIWDNPEQFGITILDRDYTKYLQAGKKARCVIKTRDLGKTRLESLVKEAQESWKS